MDVTELRSVKQAAARIGIGAVDVLINSAGIAGKPHQKAGNVDYESWAAVFNVNTMAPLRVTEAFLDHLSRSERKLVVTLTSSMGSLTDRQHIRRLDCSSQFEGGREHGDAERRESATPTFDRSVLTKVAS